MKHAPEFWALAAKYLGREMNEAEQADFLILLEKDPELKKEWEKMETAWQQEISTAASTPGRLFSLTQKKIKEYEEGLREAPELAPVDIDAGPLPSGLQKRKPVWRFIAAAAILTGIIAGAFLISQELEHKELPAKMLSVTVPEGARKTIVLPDGSKVYLNAGSRMEYEASFAGNTRSVSLSGEAFFEIAKDPVKPFIVNSTVLQSKVLGTSFNMRVYEDDDNQSVSVSTGKVEISAKGKVLNVLTPDHTIVYSKIDSSYSNSVAAGESMNWRNNILAYTDISFKDLARILERQSGSTIIFDTKGMENCRNRVYFKNKTVDQIIHQLSIINGFQYHRSGDTIRLSGKPCY